ncbi:MAG: hypothetical protein QM756_06955 [Polyangiaceae bacterium]
MQSCSEDEDEDFTFGRKNSLEMQRAFGWSFGAALESVTFDGAMTKPFDRAALTNMASAMRPPSSRGFSYYGPALFESLGARPTSTLDSADAETIVPLEQVLMPIFTDGMKYAYEQGRAFASLFETSEGQDLLVIVDLDGPESVAFAAGASSRFEPVFIFGNWPHPRGVVKAHRTLAAAAYYQPLFSAGSRASGPLMLVLDRQRLAPYTDDATQFDNRYVPVLPTHSVLASWGVRHVLYIAPLPTDRDEPWDVSDAFVDYANNGFDVKMLAANSFAPATSATSTNVDTERFYYGGSPKTHSWFWHDYPWSVRPQPRAEEPIIPRYGKSYVPPSASRGGKPSDFGSVPVVLSKRSGRVAGALLNRNGSWNRSYASGGG